MTLKLEDLFIRCDECEGSGSYSGPPKPGAAPSYGRNPIMVFGPCDRCDGQGGTITEAGQAVLEFLRIMRGKGRL